MLPHDVLDAIHDDIDRMILSISREIDMFSSQFVKDKFDFDNKVDFIYGMQIGKSYRLFSFLMGQKGIKSSLSQMIEFADILYKRAIEIRQAILKVLQSVD